MTLGEHLAELRRRVVICVARLRRRRPIVAFIVYPHILHFLQAPYCRVAGARHCQLYVTAPLDGLSLRIKLADLRRRCSWRRR